MCAAIPRRKRLPYMQVFRFCTNQGRQTQSVPAAFGISDEQHVAAFRPPEPAPRGGSLTRPPPAPPMRSPVFDFFLRLFFGSFAKSPLLIGPVACDCAYALPVATGVTPMDATAKAMQ
jgi:hypothetical protein